MVVFQLLALSEVGCVVVFNFMTLDNDDGVFFSFNFWMLTDEGWVVFFHFRMLADRGGCVAKI